MNYTADYITVISNLFLEKLLTLNILPILVKIISTEIIEKIVFYELT